MLRTRPARWAGPCQRITDSTAFNVGIFAVIVANAVALGLETFAGVEQSIGHLLQQLDHAFIGIFVVELLIRIGAYGSRPQDFFKDGWNVFDFVVITAAFVPGLRENATLLRLLVTSIWRSLPGVASLAVLGVLMLYVYGMVGWVLFHEQYPKEWGSVGQAMLTLFILLSMENLPTQIQQGQVVSSWTLIYFVSYVLIAAFLLVNILIGVVINSMQEAREIEWQREQRRRHGASGSEEDRRASIEQRLHDLRAAVDSLEHELRRPPPD